MAYIQVVPVTAVEIVAMLSFYLVYLIFEC